MAAFVSNFLINMNKTESKTSVVNRYFIISIFILSLTVISVTISFGDNSVKKSKITKSQTFKNPIIPGFNPDPSICRVGSDYYLVTSTFEYFPGVPVYHSKDLVNWQLIGYALNRPSQLDLTGVECSGGIYAPTLRYNNGIFYMITTIVGQPQKPNHQNFIVTAKNPAGPWSEPHFIENAEGIDPSLFFDDDGKVYYSGNCLPENRVWDKHRDIWTQEIEINTWKLIGDRKIVLDGSEYYKSGTLDGGIESGVNNYEAPHIYKKDGKYYLLISHGGTSNNHAVSIWNSENVFGPYKMNPANPILTHRDLGKEYFFTSTGHADFVQTQNGEWWTVYLAKRPYGGENHIMGRETFLSPVNWDNEWPVVNPDGNIGRGDTVHRMPILPKWEFKPQAAKDEFNEKELNLYWNFIRTLKDEWWSLNKRKGFLRINLRPETIGEKVNPSFIGRRVESKNFEATSKMRFNPENDAEEAGLIVERDRNYYFKYTLSKQNGKNVLKLIQKNGSTSSDSLLAVSGVNKSDILLKVKSEGVYFNFGYSEDGKNWKWLMEDVDGRLLGLAGSGRFTGTFIGMYASSNGGESQNHADFDWFEYID